MKNRNWTEWMFGLALTLALVFFVMTPTLNYMFSYEDSIYRTIVGGTLGFLAGWHLPDRLGRGLGLMGRAIRRAVTGDPEEKECPEKSCCHHDGAP